jgi:hypothetical protein
LTELKLYQGVTKALHPVTRNRVQIELQEMPGVFELFLDQSWVVSAGDRVSLAGAKDETGKVVCYAYKNHDKGIKGWNHEISKAGGYIFIAISLIFIVIGLVAFPPHLIAIFFTIFGIRSIWNTNKTNRLYASALKLLDSAEKKFGK